MTSTNSAKNIKKRILWITITGLFMAMNIVLSMTIFSIPTPVTNLYMNNIIIVLASVLLDPVAAFMVGGVGAFLGDLIFYPAPMFVSLVTHGLQAVIISLFSHYILKKYPKVSSIIGVVIGGLVDLIGYTLGRAYIYGSNKSWATALAKLPAEILQVAIGAVIALLLCWVFGLKNIYDKNIGNQLY